MLKRILTVAALALAASLPLAAQAQPGVANFEGQAAFRCDNPGVTEHDGGLSFAQDPQGPWYTCFYSHADSADFPIVPSSTVMAIGFTDITVATDDANPFDLRSLQLAAGPWTIPGDTTFVQGFVHGGGTLTTTLTLGPRFRTYFLNWDNLDSVLFSKPQASDGYVGFDNVRYVEPINGGGVPDPAIWLVMLLGFSACGVMLRRARQLALAPID